MKKIKLLSAGLLTGISLLGFNPAQAQFKWSAQRPQDLFGPASTLISGVQNTGNDVTNFQSSELKVMVWDGDRPALGWSWKDGLVTGTIDLAGSNLRGTITDPDVVITHDETGNIIVTYVLHKDNTSSIWAEVWGFRGSSLALLQAPVQVDNLNGSNSSNPNIDLDFYLRDHGAVITFEQGGEIYGRIFNPATGPDRNIFNVSGRCFSGNNSQPDVAMYLENKTGGQTIVSFTYIHNDGRNKTLVLQQEDINNLINQAGSDCRVAYEVETVPAWQTLENPRIAAPTQLVTGIDPYDCQIVAHLNDSRKDYITGYNLNGTANGRGNIVRNILNNGYALSDCSNRFPAVSYVGKAIIASWVYDDGGCQQINGSEEILVKQLDLSGAPLYTDYSVVNDALVGSQRTVSVAGRHSIQNKALYTFYDEAYEGILYKSALFTNQNLRQGNASGLATLNSKLQVYPMPVTGTSTINYTIEEGEVSVALALYSLTGQKVKTLPVQNQAVGNYTTPLEKTGSELVPGLYELRLSSNKKQQSTKVVIQ